MRLARGAEPRREQLLVEVEVGDEPGPPPAYRGAMERGLGPDDDVGVGDVGRRRVDVDDASPGHEGGQLVTHAAHPGAQDAQLGGAALRTYRRTLGRRVPAEQLSTRRAHQQPEAPAPVEHADRRARGVMQRIGERLAQQPCSGRFVAPVDHLDAGPAAPLHIRRRDLDRLTGGEQRFDGRRRGAHRERGTCARGALAQHVATVPGRRALLLEGLVGVVDHHRRPQIR